eukprot:TRINITY_DN29233_c0_g2_i1.p1 TRINITY_DN29233_c0_g2~~TRINITY_DN29233_c0_g2_i1.p1  ORF type:complete len:592 (+),score=152.36 TRINITY_DN29233_c0_g2_i1:72-1847(+)
MAEPPAKHSRMADAQAPLFPAFLEALRGKAATAEKTGDATCAAAAAASAVRFVEENKADMEKALAVFGVDGRIADGRPMPASMYNDYYKWSMLPVAYATQRSRPGGVRCTFSVNVRDQGYRKELVDSATGRSGPELCRALEKELQGLAQRPFDRDVFERLVQSDALPNWQAEVLDYVCGPAGKPRMLADEVDVDFSCSQVRHPRQPGNVLVQAFVAKDVVLGEERVYVEASGPWPRVTWLETTMMQAVYEALFRDRMRKRYGSLVDADWYPKWLAEAFVRCARSNVAAASSGMKGFVMTGRRTGGLALMMLQSLYLKANLRNGAPLCAGTSSVTCHFWLKDAGVNEDLIPVPVGTHAHELSMVLSGVLGDIDDKSGVPLSQVVGHMLYFFLSRPNGDVRDASRRSLMPMLPDTLGTKCFMEVATKLSVPRGPHKGESVLSVIGAARQDSGTLAAFKEAVDSYGFDGPIMASEIEKAGDLATASQLGYKLFGAGGFFGDSEHAWDASVKNISMAVKALRVYVNEELSSYYPVKTGDDTTGSKFEADGTIDAATLQSLKSRVKSLQEGKCKVSQEELQKLFEAALADIIGAAA